MVHSLPCYRGNHIWQRRVTFQLSQGNLAELNPQKPMTSLEGKDVHEDFWGRIPVLFVLP